METVAGDWANKNHTPTYQTEKTAMERELLDRADAIQQRINQLKDSL
jgi:hypothetical protein